MSGETPCEIVRELTSWESALSPKAKNARKRIELADWIMYTYVHIHSISHHESHSPVSPMSPTDPRYQHLARARAIYLVVMFIPPPG